MKVTIDIPKNATIKEILEAVIKATDYEGLVNEGNCGCKGEELRECCLDDGVNPNCQLAYTKDCSGCDDWCRDFFGCEENKIDYCMTLKKAEK